MKKLWAMIVSVGVFSTLMLTSIPAFADSAFVLNTGRDGLTCTATLPPFTGVGDATLVITDSDQVNFSCHGIVFEEPPEETIRLDGVPGPFGALCKVVITPSGNFNANCKN